VAAVNSAGVVPAGAHSPLQHTSVFLVAVALSAIGLSTNVAALRKAGHRPLLLGALLWITVAAASLGLQALTRHPVTIQPLILGRPWWSAVGFGAESQSAGAAKTLRRLLVRGGAHPLAGRVRARWSTPSSP